MASHIIRRIINPQNAPKPIGPYSKGVLVDKTLYLSGQIGVDPSTNDLVKGIDNQTRQALENMKSLLVEAGCSFDNVVKVTIYLTDMQNYAKVNEVYGSYFSNVFPARTCFQVGGLPKESLVEIDAIAVLGPITEKYYHSYHWQPCVLGGDWTVMKIGPYGPTSAFSFVIPMRHDVL